MYVVLLHGALSCPPNQIISTPGLVAACSVFPSTDRPVDRPTDRVRRASAFVVVCFSVKFICTFCAFRVHFLCIFYTFLHFCAFFFQAGTELSKQESAHKEVKSTQRKIVEKKEEYAARASEISENQRRLIRSVSVVYSTRQH